MRVGESGIARRYPRLVLPALAGILLASCTATSGPGFDMGPPAYSGVGVAAVMADVAQSEGALPDEGATTSTPETAEGSASPERVASETADPASGEMAVVAAAEEQQAIERQAGAETTPSETSAAVSESGAGKMALVATTIEPEKRGFFASLFSPERKEPAPPSPDSSPEEPEVPATAADEPADPAETSPEQLVELAEALDAAKGEPDEEVASSQAPEQADVEAAPRKNGFLASFFSAPAATPAPPEPERGAPQEVAPLIAEDEAEEPEPLIDLSVKETPARTASLGDDLPGVRRTSLFEITHKSGIEDDSDVDIYEDANSPVMLASAAGLARLAPNGLLKQRDSVDVACLKPSLVRILKAVERHFGKRMIVTSGYRSPSHNRRVRGAPRSQHMYCAAADVQIPGVSKWEIARFVRDMPGRGGVGTYCHTESVHIDVGPERDWNWRCSRRS